MRTRARASRKPRALTLGPKRMDGISGEELNEYDSMTRIQRGMFVHKKNFDALLDADREYMNGRLANAAQWVPIAVTTATGIISEDGIQIVSEDGTSIGIE